MDIRYPLLSPVFLHGKQTDTGRCILNHSFCFFSSLLFYTNLIML